MRALLVTLTALEAAILVAALAYYLVRIARLLRRTTVVLGKVAFGVRAIETQTAVVGPSVTRINSQLETIAGSLDALAGAAGDGGRR